MDKFEKDLETLHPVLTECRVIKSELEIALIQYANDISSEAHVEVTVPDICNHNMKVDFDVFMHYFIFLLYFLL